MSHVCIGLLSARVGDPVLERRFVAWAAMVRSKVLWRSVSRPAASLAAISDDLDGDRVFSKCARSVVSTAASISGVASARGSLGLLDDVRWVVTKSGIVRFVSSLPGGFHFIGHSIPLIGSGALMPAR